MEGDDINSLISQLQGINNTSKNQEKILEHTPVTKDNLEEFIINQTSALIQNTNATIGTIGEVVKAAPDCKEVAALAELIKSSASALEVLNKIVLSDKKNKNMKELKKMDIDNKSVTAEQKTLKYTRDEIFKKLFENTPIDTQEVK